MPSKFVRIAVSDCEHVEEAELADFDVKKWEQDKIEEHKMTVIKTNGTILTVFLALLLLCLMIVCLTLSAVFVSPLCVDTGNSKWISLQYFLFYDSAFLGVCFISTVALLVLANQSYPEKTIKVAQFCGTFALAGMFGIQLVECIIYGKLFISTDGICPLPVATMTIVMNLLFFGGPLLVFCCVALGRTSALNFSDEIYEEEGEGEGEEGEGEGEGGDVEEGEGTPMLLQPPLGDDEHV